MIDDEVDEVKKAAKAVDRGAQLLDKCLPGWEWDIDMDTLVMSSTCNCIGGQLGSARQVPGGFSGFLSHLGLLTGDEDVDHGFQEDIDTPYDALYEAWREEIMQRRGVVA